MFDNLTDAYQEMDALQEQQCRHRRIEAFAVGGYHYSGGDVWDDIRDIFVCLDCGKQIPEEDVPAPEAATDEDDDEVLF